jgi:D-aspartate ligase
MIIADSPVLLLDATSYGTLAAVRDLGSRGVKVTLASDSWVAPARWSRHVTQSVSCPSSKDSMGLLAWLMRFGTGQRGYVLLATSDNIAWLVAAHRDALSKLFHLYTPPASSLAQLLDKGCLMQAARSCGINRPDTRVPYNEADVARSGREMGFPLFIKPRAQVLGHDLGKGMRVANEDEMMECWRSQRRSARYDEEILGLLPDLCLPMVQSCATGTAGI